MPAKPEILRIPKHVAMIMDGNRRWAEIHKLALLMGHDRVAKQIISPLVDKSIELGVTFLTLWAFSTENWGRSKEEVNGLLSLFRYAFTKQSEELFEKGVRLKSIGDTTRFPEDIQAGIKHWEEISKNNTRLTVTTAVSYSGRNSIIRAINSLAPGESATITEAEFSQRLETNFLPDPDLIIRTGGDYRTSGFMSWEASYSEYIFLTTLMPDFTPEMYQECIEEFSRRQRRFGK